jgi:hypothetical protein
MIMSASAHTERREHPRQQVQGYAHLVHSRKSRDAQLLDISVSGARLSLPEDDLLQTGDDILLTVDLIDIHVQKVSACVDLTPYEILCLRGTLVHLCDHLAGVECYPASEVDEVLLALLLAQPD